MKYNFLLTFTFALFFSSCGLRISQEVDDNVLLGAWELIEIRCAETYDSTTNIEIYNSVADLRHILTFSTGSKITYSSTGDNCSTSATGTYLTDFNGSRKGSVDLIDIITGSDTCFEDFVDSGTADVGTQSILMSLDGSFSTGLEWTVTNDESTLKIQLFNGYVGSNSVIGCGETCVCSGIYTKSI